MTKRIDVTLVHKLVSQATSLAVVSDFLKSRGLPHSAGSWDEMYERRIQPALQDGRLSVAEFVDLLRTVEEYGKQHIFLFKLKPAVAAALIDARHIKRVLASLDLEDLLSLPRVFEMPQHPSFADVRWQANGNELVIKEVLTRESFEFAGETTDGDVIQRTFKKVRERVVNVGVLRKNGTFELRMNSRRGSSRYDEDLKLLTARWKPLVDIGAMIPVSLAKAKKSLWTDRKALAKKIRYSDVTVRNDDDISLKAFGNADTANVAGNAAAQHSVDTFLKSDGYCDSSNIWFTKVEGGLPSRDIHVVLHGAHNEFAVPTNCSQADYEYVLSELLGLNT